MRNTLCFFAFVILLLGATSCEEIPPEIPPFQPPSGDRNVILEEWSGVKCANCPQGTAQIDNLKALYGDRVVAITAHAFLTGPLSQPHSNSTYDFRTEAADEVLKSIGIPQGIPSAAINRVDFPEDGIFLLPNQWASKVDQLVNSDAPVSVILRPSFDQESRVLTVEVEVFSQERIEGDIRFHMGLTEDNIIDVQTDGANIVQDYNHKHVLRAYLTNFAGDNMASTIDRGDRWMKTYSFQVPESDGGWWKVEDMYIFGFVSNVLRDSKEVLQATEVSLLPE